MGTCPNCGNWVEDGDVCGVCGGSSSYSPDYEEEEIQYNNPGNYKINRSLAYRENAYRNAKNSFKKKNYKSAIINCDKYLNTKHKELQILLLKAKSLFEMEKYEEALDCCEDSLKHCQELKKYDDEQFYKSNGYEFWQLKGDCQLKLNQISQSIDSIEYGLNLINGTFDRDHARYYYLEEFQTERYYALASLVASKLMALQILGKSEKAQDFYKKYAFIKIIEYPIFLEDMHSIKEYKLYPLIRKSFEEKKLKLGFNELVFPEKVVYCKSCGKKIDYVRYIENKKVCPICKKYRSISNSEAEYQDYLKKEEERLEREKREKELREQDPIYLKKEIENQKSVFKTSRLLLRLESFQKNADEKFKEILRLEELLEKCEVEIDYNLKQLKKENKRLKYCIEHFEDKYTPNAKRLLENNLEKINNIEKGKEEKIIIKITD